MSSKTDLNNGISVEKLEEIFNFTSDDIKIKDYFPKEYEQFKEVFEKAKKWSDFMANGCIMEHSDGDLEGFRTTGRIINVKEFHNLKQKLEKIGELVNSSRMMKSQLGFDLQCVETEKLNEILKTTDHSNGSGDKNNG